MVGDCGELCTFTVAYYNKVKSMFRFLGNIEAKVDAKGRVFLPAVFRKQLEVAAEERLVLRKDVFQDCLVLYPERVWFATQDQLRSRLNKWSAREQALFRQFVSDAVMVTIDDNGRILLPRRCMQMIGIRSDVCFVGMDDTIEIWAGERSGLSFLDAESFGRALEEALVATPGGEERCLEKENENT